MLFLVMDISYHSGQVFLAKRQHPIFVLPVKGQIRFDDVVDKMRGIPFDLANETGRGKFGRQGNGEVDVVLNPANCMNEAVHFLHLGSNRAIQIRFKNRVD